MGYDGDRPVFICHLTAKEAATILTGPDVDGDIAVEAASGQATTAYSSVVIALKEVINARFADRSDDLACANGVEVAGGVGS